MTRAGTALAVLLVAAPAGAADTPLDRPELARRGKAATAVLLIQTADRTTSGTAFVVNPDGYLVTCASLLPDTTRQATRLTVILNPGQPNQLALPAAVARVKAEWNMALLRVTPPAPLPALPIGNSLDVKVKDAVVAFGYPADPGKPPSVAAPPDLEVRPQKVATLLRAVDGVLIGLELEAIFNPGLTGGPVLDAAGRVVGVIDARRFDSNVLRAITTGAVYWFLVSPDLSFQLPAVTPSKPAEFTATARSPIPPGGADAIALELVLDAGDGSPRVVPMTAAGKGAYKATATPLPATDPPVTVTARFGNLTMSGPVPDRAITVGGKPTTLGKARELTGTKTTLHDGTVLPGAVAGLDGLRLTDNGREVPLDLAKADVLTVAPPVRPTAVVCSVVAKVGGKEVARVQQTMPVPVAGKPTAASEGRVTHTLAAPFSDVCMGGGGEYLLFHLPTLSRIDLFDLAMAKVVHSFPCPEAEARFAAGADKLVVHLPGIGVLQRWDLTSRRRELTVPFEVKAEAPPFRRPAGGVPLALGHSSAGPLLVGVDPFDLATLRPLALAGDQDRWWGFTNDLRLRRFATAAAANGSTVGAWKLEGSPTGVYSLILEAGRKTAHGLHRSDGHVVPGPDGRLVFTGMGIYEKDLRSSAGGKSHSVRAHLPAAHGRFYFGLVLADPPAAPTPTEPPVHVPGRMPVRVALHLATSYSEIGWFDLPAIDSGQVASLNDTIGIHKRYWLLPDAKLFVRLPVSNDTVELTQYDLDESAERTGRNYLYLAADPPAEVRRGVPFEYKLAVRSKKGGANCQLKTGPEGMTVTPDGIIRWPAPAGQEVTAVIVVGDASGQQSFHSIVLRVRD